MFTKDGLVPSGHFGSSLTIARIHQPAHRMGEGGVLSLAIHQCSSRATFANICEERFGIYHIGILMVSVGFCCARPLKYGDLELRKLCGVIPSRVAEFTSQ